MMTDLARKRAIAFGFIPAEGESHLERDMRRAKVVMLYGKPFMKQRADGTWDCMSHGKCAHGEKAADAYMLWLLMAAGYPTRFEFEFFGALPDQPAGAKGVIEAGENCMKRWLNG